MSDHHEPPREDPKYRGRHYACECVELAHVSDNRLAALVAAFPDDYAAQVDAVTCAYLKQALADLERG